MNDPRTSSPTSPGDPSSEASRKNAPCPNKVREFPHQRRSDADLVRAVAEGDDASLAVIWNRHCESVRRTLRGCLGTDESLDDLTQEVFLSLVRNAARIESPERLRAYLCGAAVRQARRKHRERARRKRWLGLFAEQAEREASGSVVHDRAALRRLETILAELPERLRETFVLRFVEGIPTVELAEIRRVSLATAKRDVVRAQERVVLRARRDEQLSAYLYREREGDGHGMDARSEPEEGDDDPMAREGERRWCVEPSDGKRGEPR